MARNKNYFALGLVVGASMLASFLQVVATHYFLKLRDKEQTYTNGEGTYSIYEPPIILSVSPDMREKMAYLDQTKSEFNPFEVLDIPIGSTKEIIARAYKKLSLQYHPDKHPQERDLYTEIFQIIGQAKESADWISDYIMKDPAQLRRSESKEQKRLKNVERLRLGR
jgi:hypothetical protein